MTTPPAQEAKAQRLVRRAADAPQRADGRGLAPRRRPQQRPPPHTPRRRREPRGRPSRSDASRRAHARDRGGPRSPDRRARAGARRCACRPRSASPPSPPPRPRRAAELTSRATSALPSAESTRRRSAAADADEVDEFGYDPAYERKLLPFFELLYEKYFRVEAHGIERLPGEGRCLLVANHSGTLPLDGLMLRLAVRREHQQHRSVRWLAEDGIFHFPFLGSFTNRMGAVRACQENAERLLAQEALVAVFPEGMKGIGKLFRDRYRLQRFGRGGFVKLCMRTRTPVVPVAIVGSEETNPMLARVEHLARAVGIPYLPVTPTFPLLGPLGLLPAPTKWKIFFGEPIDVAGYAPASADDEILVGRLAERVRGAIQSMLDRAVAARRSVWFG